MTRSWWTSWKTYRLALPLALAFSGQTDAGPTQAQGTIFVADAATGRGSLVDRLIQLVNGAGLPLNVQQVFWSTLNERTDFQGQHNFAVNSRQLANRILELRRNCPTTKIYLVGYGAGTTVILKAAEYLPTGGVDHIFLLAPSVSCCYDLCLALQASREGIDSFFSPDDELLRHAIERFGTTDVGVRGGTCAAGLSGFQALSMLPRDQAIYARLRQHRLSQAGDEGNVGHLAYKQTRFLQNYVVSVIEASLVDARVSPVYPSVPAPQYSPSIPPCQTPPAPQYPTPPGPAPQYPMPPAPPAYSPVPTPRYPPSIPPCQTPPAPTPQYPMPPAPAPQYPTPGPAPQYPMPSMPAPRYPTPSPPTPQVPTPQAPTPQHPAPQVPTPQYPVPQIPAPQYPTPQVPAPQLPSPAPTPEYPTPLPPGPAIPRHLQLLVPSPQSQFGPSTQRPQSLPYTQTSRYATPAQSAIYRTPQQAPVR